MAKFVKLATINGEVYFNLNLIETIQVTGNEGNEGGRFEVDINNITLQDTFTTKDAAEKFVKDFLEENYILTEKA